MENLSEGKKDPWRVWLGLAGVAVATLLSASWPWGVLVLLWVIAGAATGTIHFLDEIHAKQSPVLFAAVTILWAACGVYWIAIDLM